MPLREGAHLQPRLLKRAAGVSAQAELLSYGEHLGMRKLLKQSAKSQLMRILATGCRALARLPTGHANLTLQQTLTVHNCPGLQVAARHCGPAPDGRNICTWWGSHGRSSAFCCRHCTRASRESCASWRSCLPCNTSSIDFEEAVELQSAQATRGLAVDAHPAAAVEIDSAVHAAIAAARPALWAAMQGSLLAAIPQRTNAGVVRQGLHPAAQLTTLLRARHTPFPADLAAHCKHSGTWQSSTWGGAMLAAAAWLACAALSSSRPRAGPPCAQQSHLQSGDTAVVCLPVAVDVDGGHAPEGLGALGQPVGPQ